MEILFFIAASIIIGYLAVTIVNFGIPKSISETYYLWKSKGLKYLFTFVMWITGFLLVIYWVDVSPKALQFLPFLSVSGMIFVGAACAFKEELTDVVHYTSAGIWAGAALLYFILTKNWESIFIGSVFGFLTCICSEAKSKGCFTFWLECACVLMMIVGLLIQ